jgi:ribulose-phosphate 3-epimerase
VEVYVSLWSADLLDIGRAIDLVAGSADGLHIDVFDGHDVDDLLFGPDFVAAVRARTTLLLDVHLNVDRPDHWAQRFVDVGADMVTVQTGASPDIAQTMAAIRAAGARPSLGVELHEPVDRAAELAEAVDRYLLMGTEIGIKGVGLDPSTTARVTELRALTEAAGTARPVFVDGGIRAGTVPALAAAGAHGVIPGSLVFGAPDPVAAIDDLHHLTRSSA